jgi:hypothetical protein
MQATETKPIIPTDRTALHFNVAAFAAGLTTPALASAPDADAELIPLCDRIVQNEAKQADLFATISNDDELTAALDPLALQQRDMLTQIEQIEGPTTMAGARAMARTALALMPRGPDGDLEVGNEPEDWLHASIAEFLVGSAAA